MKKMFIFIFVFIIYSYFNNNLDKLGVVELEPNIYPTYESYELSMLMLGDVLYHYDVYLDSYLGNNQYDFTDNLTHMKDLVSSYDLAYYNQESILGGVNLGLDSYPRFNSPQEVGDAFIDAGFNMISLANNHTLDQGESGIIESLTYWNDKDVITAGSYLSQEDKSEIKIYTTNNITYAFFSYTTTTNGLSIPSSKDYLVDVYSFEQASKDIKQVRDLVDFVFVAMHWGDEYQFSPNNNQISIANDLSTLGVDIIIGAHPHVIEPIEFIDDTLVIYSLGNLISGQLGIERNIGLMATLTLKKEIIDAVAYTKLEDINADLIYTYKEIYNSLNYGRNYTIYPFYALDDNILENYEYYKNYYEAYINPKEDSRITIGQLSFDK